MLNGGNKINNITFDHGLIELKKLLSQDIKNIYMKNDSFLEKQAGAGNSNFIIFGAGSLGKKTLYGLRQVGIEPLAFSDSDSKIWGSSIDGLKVLDPHDAADRFGCNATFIVTIWNPESQRYSTTNNQLKRLGCNSVVSFTQLFLKYPEIFLPYYAIDKPDIVINNRSEVEKAYHLLGDPISKDEYIRHIKFRLTGDLDVLPLADEGVQYFPNFLKLPKDIVFVDIGAFDGDTIEAFLNHCKGNFKAAYALEPDPLNYVKLLERREKWDSKIQNIVNCREKAAGNINQMIHFNATGTLGSKSGCGEHEVECVRLDDILELEGPTYIKMDIEGAELEAIEGTKDIIKSYAPTMAVCVYHRPDDLWKIPIYINNLREDYYFFFRTHKEQGWDAVLYAIPNNKVIK